ncbi:MAG: hypothetical protein MK202_16795 [Tenacibaculum sp.]|nr:hypothetical protein [Tenacibaculum sp.]
MKKLYFILLIFTSNVLLSQNEYAYLVETKIVGALHANVGQMSISTNLGPVTTLNYGANTSTLGDTYYNFIRLPDNFNTANIRVYNYAIALGSFPNCEYNDDYPTTKESFGDPTIFFLGCSFNQRVYSLHIYEEADKLLNGVCIDDTLTLNFGYEWQFSFDGVNWEDFPVAYNKKPVSSFVLKDLLTDSGVDVNSLNENQIKFRTGYNNNYTNIITYEIVPCPPKLVGEIITAKTTCNYSTDGKFTMAVDRDLELDEKLIVSLYALDNVNSSYYFLTQESTNSLINNSSLSYSYTWQGDIAANKYRIKYQILKGGGSSIPSNDQSWTKIGFSDEFSITNSDVFNFSALKINNETCFEKNDGKIRITISSKEAGRTFQYRLYKVSGSTVTVFKDWTDFSNDSFDVGGLDESTYRIKVRDNKKCYAR